MNRVTADDAGTPAELPLDIAGRARCSEPAMHHYCTYFNRAYLTAGVALWRSLQRHEPDAVLWVLALDDEAAAALRALAGRDSGLRVLTAAEIEAADPELAHSRATRSWLEHLFTFSPCWPRHLLRAHPELPAITYLDADLWFLHAPAPLHAEWAQGSVYVTRHDLPAHLASREERYGRFNVGVLGFRNDAAGRACLDWWRERCLEWCKDVPEPDRYADQKYLDRWPEMFSGVVVAQHAGVNVAPWNWWSRGLTRAGEEWGANGVPLVVFHFAQLRRLGAGVIDSNQADYGVMPFRLRPLYSQYLDALDAAACELREALGTELPATPRPRGRHGFRRWVFAVLFGTVWLRFGNQWLSGGFGLGRFSGRMLAWQHRLRGKPS